MKYLFRICMVAGAIFLMAPIILLAQDKGHADIAQLEKDMYRYFSSSESDSFMIVTDRLMEACRQAGRSQEWLFYKAWSNQAIYSFSKVSRTRGLELAQQIHDYAHQHDSKFGLYTSLYALSTMQSVLRRYDQAEKGFLEAIDYQHRFFPDESAAAPYLGLAKIYYNLKQPEKVLECARKALAEPGVIQQHQLSAWSYICIALSTNKYSKEEFNRAYADREKVKQEYGHDDNYGEYVDMQYAYKNGRLDEALKLAGRMKSNVDRMNKQSEIYAALGNYKEAYLWHKRYKEYSDSVNNAEVQQLSYEYATQLDVDRKSVV